MSRVLIKLFLLFILVYAGVTLGYGQLEKRLLVSSVVVPDQTATTTPAEESKPVLQKSSNYQIIVGRNIFEAVPEQKKVQPKKKEPVKVVEKAPEETKLKLVLHGTVSGSSDQDSRAIIVDQKEKRQDLYQIGDAVQGALIISIERGKVVLELNGKKQFLLLKDREGGGLGELGSSLSTESSPKPRKSTFVMKASRTAFSKTPKKTPPTAVPHRRISFRQDNDDEQDKETGDYEEPEEPLVEEDLEMEEPPF